MHVSACEQPEVTGTAHRYRIDFVQIILELTVCRAYPSGVVRIFFHLTLTKSTEISTAGVVSDPTGTLLSANHSGDVAVSVTGTDMKIAPVFDITGAVVSDPTGTILSVIH